MGIIKEGDGLVQSVTLYKDRPWPLHGYVLPFTVIYAAWFHAWLFTDFYGHSLEGGIICLVGIFVAQVIVVLACVWSVHVMALVTCTKVSRPQEATYAKFVPTSNNGSSELVRLRRRPQTGEMWVIFQKLKYSWCEEANEFQALEFPVDKKFSYYLHALGHTNDEQLEEVYRIFGDNKVDMTIPEFKELFKERATAPFFVFQVFCVLLWCMDEYVYYSLFTLLMLVVFECTLVNQQLRNMSEIRKMGNKPYMIQVYRNRRWRQISSENIVTGDIVSVTRSQDDHLVPCDMVLLRGPCIVDESMLTGEAVPQMKEAIENVSALDQDFNENSNGKLHLLYGGTKIVQHTPPSKTGDGLRPPDNGCVAYALRTGFNTSQGKLLRTILYSVQRVTANNLETFGFILFLLFFAIISSAYLWIEGTKDPSRNRYKLFLECTLILTSVVPPELPIELSLAVNTSLLSLSKLAVFCTEPFRIPFCGKVEICCFDKTGTLTTDSLVVEGVAGVNGEDDTNIVSIDKAPTESIQVLATCHSLVQMDNEGLVGDPLEKATLEAIEWNLTKGEAVIPKRGRHPAIKIFHRHHFSSSLKRMCVVAGYTEAMQSDATVIAAVKGAPETLKAMLKNVPENYDRAYLTWSRKGARVLALAMKKLAPMNPSKAKDIPRGELERDLTFAGFVVISCPLKADSKSVIKELVNASHHVTMITGDNALTACHVARELRFTKTKSTLILTRNLKGQWGWESVNQDVFHPLEISQVNAIHQQNDLCLTGDGIDYLRQNFDQKLLAAFLPKIKVFARTDPKQKEFAITTMQEAGFTVLMCGDGTNDVGALKHAQVGVAILTSPPIKPEKNSKPKRLEEEPKKIRKLQAVEASDSLQKKPRSSGDSKYDKKLQELLKEIEEQERAQIVKLGDASIAAPFTSKQSSIVTINHIIKQGRCTLVTTMQMFKILALNALILAYSQSVLYLEGVKFSDTQATLQGILLAFCFLFISRSRPVKVLSKQRPLPTIFNAYTIFTVLTQFFVHFGCLFYLVQQAMLADPRPEDEPYPDLEKEFEPNLLNSTVYMISMTLQLATFAINYRVNFPNLK